MTHIKPNFTYLVFIKTRFVTLKVVFYYVTKYFTINMVYIDLFEFYQIGYL